MDSDDVVRVLVVDDHPVVLQGISFILDDMTGFLLAGMAADGPSAVRESHRLQPDIVLLDVRIGEESAAENVMGVRSASPASAVLLFTADPHHPGVLPALAAGAHGPISKHTHPARIRDLLFHLANHGALPTARKAAGDCEGRPALSTRELDVLHRVALGRTNAEIAGELGIRSSTVKSYWQTAMGKLDARNRAEATAKAHRWGLLSH